MLAREYCDASSRKGTKPVILSHHMLYGLKQGQAKMSKSDPDSAIFMEDSRDDIARKLTLAFCPTSSSSANGGAAAVADGELRLAVDDLENPCLDYVKHIVLADRQGATFTAGGQTYASYEAVKEALTSGKLSESALKEGLIDEVDKLVAPVRQHFENDQEAKALLSRIEGYKKEDAAAVAKEALTKPLRCGNLLGGDGGAKEVMAQNRKV
jgi:tyrosyl-tRNA synthetase